jgi:hypothetical protein
MQGHRLGIKISGLAVPLLAFALVGRQADHRAITAMEGFIAVQHRLHLVIAGLKP